MTGKKAVPPGVEILAQAEREIGRGNLRKGAGLAWQAAEAALMACAARHGMPCANRGDALQLVRYLDQVASAANPSDYGAKYRNTGAWFTADAFREHYETPEQLAEDGIEWEPDEYQLFLPSVQMFITRLNASNQCTGTRV